MTDTTLRRGFRPEIQGLRAVAVLLVIAYHLYPNRVSGGYVGVDVFFVLSGYLITAHLVRDAADGRRPSLLRFWARRIRRLLPASLLVLAVSLVLAYVWLPRSLWDESLRHITMSALYVENWALAADAVDYSAMGNDPTLVQHYWSLSVEEQFYLVWPLLVVAAVLVVRRWARATLPVTLAVFLGTVTLASFAYSLVATSSDAAWAYFVTPTRAWEFGIGALIALLGSAPEGWWRDREVPRVLAGWLGLAAILWAGLALDDSTPFPGWIAAVPVLGTAAVVLAGSGGSRAAAARPLSWRPMTFVGDISYSMYLWHWPLIVVLPFVTGSDLRTRDKIGILLASVLLSWACTRWVEDPVRTARWLADVPWRAYAAGAAGMAVVIAGSLSMQVKLDRDIAAAEAASQRALDEALAGTEPCLGPSAIDDPATCGPVSGDGDPPLDTAAVARQNVEATYPECMAGFEELALMPCDLGAEDGPRTVAVVGDSHATALLGMLDELGQQRDWRVVSYTRASCPFTDARRVLAEEPPKYYRVCRQNNIDVEQLLVEAEEIDTVFVTAFSSAYEWDQAPGTDFADPATDGFRALWRRLTAAGKQVVVVRDVPIVKDRIETPICLDRNGGAALACANSRAAALQPDAEADAVEGAPRGVRLVDLTDRFCDEELCHAVVGDVIVYRDGSHLSHEYATLLAPYLGAAFDAVDEPVGG